MAVLHFRKPETNVYVYFFYSTLILLVDKIINIYFKVEKRTETFGIQK